MSQVTKSFQEARQLRRFRKAERVPNQQGLPENDITSKDVVAFFGFTVVGALLIFSIIFTFYIVGYILVP